MEENNEPFITPPRIDLLEQIKLIHQLKIDRILNERDESAQPIHLELHKQQEIFSTISFEIELLEVLIDVFDEPGKIDDYQDFCQALHVKLNTISDNSLIEYENSFKERDRIATPEGYKPITAELIDEAINHRKIILQPILDEYSIEITRETDTASLIYDIKTLLSQKVLLSNITEKRKATFCMELGLQEHMTDMALQVNDLNKQKAISDTIMTLQKTAQIGDLNSIQRLLKTSKAKKVINVPDASEYEAYALHYACESMNPKIIEALLKKGAQVNVRDYYRYTPLHWLMRITTYRYSEPGLIKRFHDCLDVLLDAGADLLALDRIGRSILHTAAYYGNYHGILWCIKKGLDLNIAETDHPFYTPLTSAIDKGHEHAAKLLVLSGASNITTNEMIHTPLYFVIMRNKLSLAFFLQDHGFTLTKLERQEYARQIKKDSYSADLKYIITRLHQRALEQFGLSCEQPKFGPGYEKVKGRKLLSNINGRAIQMVEYKKTAKDACYHLMNINRVQLCVEMNLLSGNKKLREYLAPEIAEAISIETCNIPREQKQTAECLVKSLNRHKTLFHNIINTILSEHIKDDGSFLTIKQLKIWLEENDKKDLLVRVTSAEKNVQQAKNNLVAYAMEKDIFEVYFTKMIGKVIDPGYRTLIYWCQQKHANVYVWKKSLFENCNRLRLSKKDTLYQDSNENTFHILINEHFHDFSTLEMRPPKPNDKVVKLGLMKDTSKENVIAKNTPKNNADNAEGSSHGNSSKLELII